MIQLETYRPTPYNNVIGQVCTTMIKELEQIGKDFKTKHGHSEALTNYNIAVKSLRGRYFDYEEMLTIFPDKVLEYNLTEKDLTSMTQAIKKYNKKYMLETAK